MVTPTDTPFSDETGDLVAVGVIVSAHGIHGKVKIRSFTADPQDILSYGALLDKTGKRRFDIVINGETQNGLIAHITGIEDRNAAEALRGTELYIHRSALPETQEEEFYYSDLIGLPVQDNGGCAIGKVMAVHNFGAGDIIEISLHSTGKRELYPFTKEIFPEISPSRGICIANLPEIIPVKSEDDGT